MVKEDQECYASKKQREVLKNLITFPYVTNSFFLTGGTALSVFYLHHRVSEDLDFFTREQMDITSVDLFIRSYWSDKSAKCFSTDTYASYLIDELKVEFVHDWLSNNSERPRFLFENNHSLIIDNISNIASNKLDTLVNRSEPKDFIDFYFLMQTYSNLELQTIYQDALAKDAIFEDSATVAYQLERSFNIVKNSTDRFPRMLKNLSKEEFDLFYHGLIKWIYGKLN